MQFDLPKEKSSIIKVIGVGGGGSNAVNFMYSKGIKGVNFVICNTDAQALELSAIPNKIQLGPDLTEGMGAGSKPEIGRQATEESIEEMKSILEINTKMVFITAGMGGGTGTGGAPVLARICREMDILTVGIITVPFDFEGKRRMGQAKNGLEALREHVDTLIVITNDKLRTIYGNLTISDAFAKADNVLATAAKGIAEIITVPGYVNVDFEDVKTVMKDSGVAIMGSGTAEGQHRAIRAVEAALSSQLLHDDDISGAKHILLNITSGKQEVLMDEITEITGYVQDQAGNHTDIIWGNCTDEDLGDKLTVTVIATGFESRVVKDKPEGNKKVKFNLDGRIEDDSPLKPVSEADPSMPHLVHDDQTVNDEEQPRTFDMDVKDQDTDKSLQFTTYKKDEDGVDEEQDNLPGMQEINPNLHISKTVYPNGIGKEKELERMKNLNKLSVNLDNTENLKHLESVPAYKRKEIELKNVPHSSEPTFSRLSLTGESGNKNDDDFSLKKNSYLHDAVD